LLAHVAQGAGFVVLPQRDVCAARSLKISITILSTQLLGAAKVGSGSRSLCSALAYYFHVTLKTDCEIKRSLKTGHGKIETFATPN
jgi:hypothetical protein